MRARRSLEVGPWGEAKAEKQRRLDSGRRYIVDVALLMQKPAAETAPKEETVAPRLLSHFYQQGVALARFLLGCE